MKDRGQTLVEFGLLLALVTMAVIGMGLYARRGTMAMVKTLSDEVGTQQKEPASDRRRTYQHSETTQQDSSTSTYAQSIGGASDLTVNSVSTARGPSVSIVETDL